jgi:hypothetical protein
MSDTATTPSKRITDVFNQMKADGCEFFLNSRLKPTVKIPDDEFQTEWATDDQRVQDLLVSLHYELTGELLKPAERDFLLTQLREECRKGGRRFSEIEADETEKDVIVQAILCLMNRNIAFSGPMVLLQKRLGDLQATGALHYTDDIPVFTNIFSRKLRRLIPALKGYGVSVSIEHKEDGSHCTLDCLETFQREPTMAVTQADASSDESSESSSDVTTRQGKDLPPTDDSDGENRVDPPISKKQTAASEESTVTETCQESQVTSDSEGGAK